MELSERERELIRARFVELYTSHYGEGPFAAIAGLVDAILVGELMVKRDYPETWPVSEVVPMLRQAWLECVMPGPV